MESCLITLAWGDFPLLMLFTILSLSDIDWMEGIDDYGKIPFAVENITLVGSFDEGIGLNYCLGEYFFAKTFYMVDKPSNF